MSSGFADTHDELRAVARDLLAKASPRSAGGGASAPPDWRLLAESGWLGLEVPERLGGAGATLAEIAVILEEMGRAAAPGPYLGSVVLGVGALNLLEPTPGRDELLRGVAAGQVVVAVALATDDETVAAEAAPFRVDRSAGRVRVHGEGRFVPDAAGADHLLLLATDPDSGPVVVHAESDQRLGIVAQPVVDATRRFACVTADGIEVNEDAVWRFAGDPDASARRLLDRGAVAIASDSLGLSEAMLEATVAYAGVRSQFGRPIGSFQAVKHACADMLVRISVSRELVAAAVDGLTGTHGHAVTAASMAKSYACDAAVAVVGKAMQLHGGIGYTWESGIHVYLKRAALNRSLFGSSQVHRRRIAQRLVKGEPFSPDVQAR